MRLRLIILSCLLAGTLMAAPDPAARGAPAAPARAEDASPPTSPQAGEAVSTLPQSPDRRLTVRPVTHETLAMEEAVQIALRESPLVRGAAAEVEAAIGQLGIARSSTRPIVSANAFAGGGSMGNLFTTTAPVMPQMIQNVGPGRFFDQNFTVMYPLSTGGRLRALVRQAEAVRRAESADLAAVRLEVATMTRIAYRQAQYQQALLAVYEALTTTHRERLRITQTAFQVEKVPQFYVLRDEAELANAEQQRTNARRDAEQAMVQLKTWMGVSLASDLRLAEPARFEPVSTVLARLGAGATNDQRPTTNDQGATTDRRPPTTDEQAPIAEERPNAQRPTPDTQHPTPDTRPAGPDALPALLRLAEQQRPELTAARARLAGGQEGVREARSLYQPQIGVGAMADFMKMRDRDLLGGTTFGVVASLPILDGGLRRAQVREAEAERERLAQEREKTILQVYQETANAWLALQAAAQNVRTAEAGRRSAQEDYRVTLIRYEAGKGINVEVLDAVAARTRAETNVAQALYEYGAAQDQLARAIGRTIAPAPPVPPAPAAPGGEEKE